MAPSEKALEAWFRGQVKSRGGWTVKFAPLLRGNPDRIVMLDGVVYLVELKTTAGQLSAIQKVWHAKAARCGVKVVVLHGREEMTAWLNSVTTSDTA